MSRLLLLLLLKYLVVCGEASPAARRLYFGLDQEDPVPDADFPGKPFTYRRSGHHRSRRLVFPGSDPAPPSPRSASRIFFPGQTPAEPAAPAAGVDNRASSSGITTVGAVWFPGANRDAPPTGLASKCEVGADLKYIYEGSTWKLLSRGPCAEGQWAVIVAECQPGCRPLPCPTGQLEHQGRCVNLTDPTVCGGGQILYVDQSGSTFCDCINDHLYYPWDGMCYARQERGPCDFGFYLDLNGEGGVECMPNDCQVSEFAKDPATGKCFRKDYVGYCPEDRLQFNNTKQSVECFLIDIRAILGPAITRSCTAGSGLDYQGNCRPEFVMPTVTALPRSLSTGCYSGSIRAGGGVCRRSNNFF